MKKSTSQPHPGGNQAEKQLLTCISGKTTSCRQAGGQKEQKLKKTEDLLEDVVELLEGETPNRSKSERPRTAP